MDLECIEVWVAIGWLIALFGGSGPEWPTIDGPGSFFRPSFFAGLSGSGFAFLGSSWVSAYGLPCAGLASAAALADCYRTPSPREGATA